MPRWLFLSDGLDDPWMARLLHGLREGRTTIVTLLLFEAAGLPLAVVRDFLGMLGDLAKPRAVWERAVEFVRRHLAEKGTQCDERG